MEFLQSLSISTISSGVSSLFYLNLKKKFLYKTSESETNCLSWLDMSVALDSKKSNAWCLFLFISESSFW